VNRLELEISKKELAEIYNKLNNWEWDYRLGVKPENWDMLPNYKRENVYSYLTKFEISKPYVILIKKAIGEKECLRYHHMHNLGKSNLQFEIYWIKRSFNRIFRSGF
jgi:hypothetical protein